MAKHSKPQEKRKIIQLKDHLPGRQPEKEEPRQDQPEEEGPQVSVEYEDEPGSQDAKKAWQAPKAFYRAAVVLLVAVLGLALWVNRDNLTPQKIWSWLQVQVAGDGAGDGFPVSITGSQVTAGNFLFDNGSVVALSDTSLTMTGSSGQEVLSLRHSFNQPILEASSGHYLLYNQDGTGYMVVTGTEKKLEKTAEKNILAGAMAPNGRYALATEGEEGASTLTVYLATGEEQFTYHFAQDYITSVALNADGTWAMVCTVRSQGGELVSKITVFDLNQASPVGEYESRGNLLVDAYWGSNGILYAVGDVSLVRARSSELSFSEYSYQGRTPTAFQFAGGQLYLSVSAYEHAGACTLLTFRGLEDPVEIQVEERVQALAVSGGSVGALVGQELILYDSSTGKELARGDAGGDAKSIALANESTAYVLGVSEIRKVQF
jgi:hypothetical protein